MVHIYTKEGQEQSILKQTNEILFEKYKIWKAAVQIETEIPPNY